MDNTLQAVLAGAGRRGAVAISSEAGSRSSCVQSARGAVLQLPPTEPWLMARGARTHGNGPQRVGGGWMEERTEPAVRAVRQRGDADARNS
jgi:hypothetical protein